MSNQIDFQKMLIIVPTFYWGLELCLISVDWLCFHLFCSTDCLRQWCKVSSSLLWPALHTTWLWRQSFVTVSTCVVVFDCCVTSLFVALLASWKTRLLLCTWCPWLLSDSYHAKLLNFLMKMSVSFLEISILVQCLELLILAPKWSLDIPIIVSGWIVQVV